MIADRTGQSEIQPTEITVSIPDVSAKSADDAVEILRRTGLAATVYGSGDEVVRQYPSAGKKVERGTIIQVMMSDDERSVADGAITVPELRGMSVRRAVNKLAAGNLGVAIVGSGVVVNQFPSPGMQAKQGIKVTIICEPKAITTAQLY
jgi:beta-lactam-binding protein with PASTA domain